MPRYTLRTLLIVLSVVVLAIAGRLLGSIAVNGYFASVKRRVHLEHQEMADESRRIQKGQPTFTEP